MLNSVTLVGRVGNEPETRHFDNGNSVATFRLAVRRPTKDNITDWFDVKVWGKQADTVAQYVNKGHLIGIVGAMQEEKWETQSGDKRSKVIVAAHSVRLMNQKENSQSQEKAKPSDAQADIFGSDDEIPF